MKPRFEPDIPTEPSALLIDPEAYDPSEQKFAVSLEEKPSPKHRFVVEDEPFAAGAPLSILEADMPEPVGSQRSATPGAPAVQADLLSQQDADSWRQEVAARVNKYRARRRPREPRYPSLRLKFDTNEPWGSPPAAGVEPPAPAVSVRHEPTLERALAAPTVKPADPLAPAPAVETLEAETSARIIEFPRSTIVPPARLDELADPVTDRPRILEAPELVPPPPALGGILMDPVETPANERRPGFEIPLQSAPMTRRLAAAATDAVLVLLAFTGFACIFFEITQVVPPVQQAAGPTVTLVGLFWAAYQYLLLVYAGTTPGLRLARLRLSRFDGSPVPRGLRRWRVLVSVLSGLSLGLGYAWCFLDEDELCWHDRITRTYMAPKPLQVNRGLERDMD